MEEKKRYTLIGYSDPIGKRTKRINFRFVMLIYRDETKHWFHGIFAEDDKTITFKAWNAEYVSPGDNAVETFVGDKMTLGYLFNGLLTIGKAKEVNQKLLEIAQLETLNPEERYDIGSHLKNSELLIAGIRECIAKYPKIKLTYKNFFVPAECEEAVEQAFAEKV